MRKQPHWREAHPPPRSCTTQKILTMRQSIMTVIFAAALLFECYSLSVAMPMSKTEDSSLEQDTITSLLSEEGMEDSLDEADLAGASKPRRQRVIVVASPSLWRTLHGGLYQKRSDSTNQAIQDLSIPILRRDAMKCMVGRVYRPCWEV